MSNQLVKGELPVRASGPGQRPGFGALRARIGAFARDASGEVAVLFGLMALAMFMMIGLAVDLGRWINARDQTIAATDAAVLAAGRALQTNGGNETEALAIANKYYAQAVQSRLKVKTDSITFAVVDNGSAVQSQGNAMIATPFMGLGGVRQLPLLRPKAVAANTYDDYSKAELKVARNADKSLEVSMMLDVSGSMGSGTKLADMKAAAKDLIDIVVWEDQDEQTAKIALIPFSGDVRPPSSIVSLVTDPSLPNSIVKSVKSGKKTTNYTYNKTACVAERAGTNKYTDAAPGSGNYVLRQYTSAGTCSTPSSSEVAPLSSNKSSLKTKVDNLALGGATAGQVGTAWAYYMLSPNWSSVVNVVSSESQPVSYSDTGTKKIAILMTDGEYNSEHDSQGITVGQSGAGSSVNGTSSANQAKSICTDMKGKGVEVFTVGFDLGGNATAIDTLQNCATDASHFYNTSTGEDLKQAFRDIALRVSPLKIVN